MNDDILDSPIEDPNTVEYNHKLTAKDRYYSMFYEYVLFGFLMAIPVSMLTAACKYILFLLFPDDTIIHRYLDFVNVILLITFLFNKDILAGQSINKRYTGQQVLDFKTKKIASPMQCFVRNITFPIWPIELLFVTNNPYRRLGDRIAGTIIVKTPTLKEKSIGLFSSLRADWRNSKKSKLVLHLFKSFILTLLVGVQCYLLIVY